MYTFVGELWGGVGGTMFNGGETFSGGGGLPGCPPLCMKPCVKVKVVVIKRS